MSESIVPLAARPVNGFDRADFQDNYPLSDDSNALRFVAQHGTDLHYCRARKQYLVWDDLRWRWDEVGAVTQRAKEVARQLWDLLEWYPRDRMWEQQVFAHVRHSRSDAGIRAMLNLAASESSIPILPEQLDSDPWLLNTPNGTIDLQTGNLREHRRTDLITKLVPVAYDPRATCPRFEAFLDQIMGGDTALVRFLKRAVGYSLTGDVRERVVLILHGGGRNGKTTLLEVIRALLGDYAMCTPAETLLVQRHEGPRNDVARLKGARFVSASETGDGRRLAEALLKGLTGGDPVPARFLYGEYFEYQPQFKLWLATNHRPEVRGTDNAIWDRIKLVPFGVRFWDPDQDGPAPDGAPLVDKGLRARLLAELPGILNWAVEGCLEWQREGLGTPPVVKAATAEYRAELDPVGRFLDECCQCSPSARVTVKGLYEAFRSHCLSAGEDVPPLRWLNAQLEVRNFQRSRSTGGRYRWAGLALKPEAVPDAEVA
jgi:putative DNA primase/helicase